MKDNNKKPIPMPQRLRDFLKEAVRREEDAPGCKGILAPLKDIAAKEMLEPADANYLSLNYNLSDKFMKTGEGEPYNWPHADNRMVVDFNGDAYRKTFIMLFHHFLPAACDMEDIVNYIQSNYAPEELDPDIYETLVSLQNRIGRFAAIGDEMMVKIDDMDNEGFATVCMSKATLLEYINGTVELISLYQEIYEFLADFFGITQWIDDDDGDNEEDDADAQDPILLARFTKSGELPN